MTRTVDIEPGDRYHREHLAAKLTQLRVAEGHTQAQLAELMYLERTAVSRFERGTNPLIGTVQRYARTLNHIARLRTAGLPDVSDDVEVALWRNLAANTDPAKADRAARAALLAELVAARHALGISQRDQAAVMRCDPTSVCEIERGDNEALLSTYQRYARALGGRAFVRLDPVLTVSPASIRLVIDGVAPFGSLNRAEKAHLFQEYGPRFGPGELGRRIRASGRTVNAWRVRVAAVAA